MRTAWSAGWLVALLLCVHSVALAEWHRNWEGFAMESPPGWSVVSKVNAQQINSQARDWAAKSKLDFNKISVVFVRPVAGNFADNMNVVVEPQQLPINGDSARQLLDLLPTQFALVGYKSSNFRVSTRKYGGLETLVIEFDSQPPLMKEKLKQKQVYFSGHGKTYIVTCSSLAERFTQIEPLFDQSLDTMKLTNEAVTQGKTPLPQLPVMSEIKLPFTFDMGGDGKASSGGLQLPFDPQQFPLANFPNTEGAEALKTPPNDPQAMAMGLLTQLTKMNGGGDSMLSNRFTWLIGLSIGASVLKTLVTLFKK